MDANILLKVICHCPSHLKLIHPKSADLGGMGGN
jgi:hypothetical protein